MIGIQGENGLEEVTKSPCDTSLDANSTNSVENRVVTQAINEINSNLFKNLTKIGNPIILTTTNNHATFTAQTKYVTIAPGIVGKYYSMPTVFPKSKLGDIGTSKYIECGIDGEGYVTFTISSSGIDIVNAKNSNSALQVILFG